MKPETLLVMNRDTMSLQFGSDELAALPPSATLVNTAQGGLIDPAALERAGSSLYDLADVVVTPHVAGSLGAETRRMSAAALAELECYAARRPSLAPVTRTSLRVQA